MPRAKITIELPQMVVKIFKASLPSAWTLLAMLTIYLSTVTKPYGFLFAPLFAIPFIYSLEGEKKFWHQIIQAIWINLAYSYSGFDWFTSPARTLWHKNIWQSEALFLLLTPLGATYFVAFALARAGLKKRLEYDFLFCLASASAFALINQILAYQNASYAQYLYRQPWMLSLSQFGGIYFITFLLVLVAELFVLARQFEGRRKFFLQVGPMTVFLALSLLIYRISYSPEVPLQSLKVLLVQTNFSPEENINQFQPPPKRAYDSLEKTLAQLKLQFANTKDTSKIDLTVYPESLFPNYYFSPDEPRATALKKSFADWVQRSGGAHAFGSVYYDGPFHSNVMAVLSKDSLPGSEQLYLKIHPMPFGEELPGADIFPILRDVFFNPFINKNGSELKLFPVSGLQFGAAICNEIFFSEVITGLKQKAADFIVLVGNESWLGESAAHQFLLAAAVVRAMENAIPVVKVANSGYSFIINERGRFIFQSELLREHFQLVDFPIIKKRVTLFTRMPDLLNILMSSIVLVGLLRPRRR